MNIEHLKAIADLVGFRVTTDAAQQIPSGPGGGHICWKINGVKESFFIKQLDPKINVNDEKMLARFELCESVAYRFSQQGIPAVSAIRGNNNSVIVLENIAYLVYPWVEGYSLKEISANHAVKIAEILAKIHKINLDVPELEPKFDVHTNEEIIEILEKISPLEAVSELLNKNQKMILEMNERYLSTIPVLKEISVVTHGDIFPHNIIWKSVNQPFLIDWEAVKKWNPTREVIRTCATWGGVGNEPFSLSLFELMLNTYTNYGGHIERNHVEAALNGMYGNIINWLLYNIDLFCRNDGQDRRDDAINQINACLTSALKLIEIYPIIFASVMKIV